MLWPKVITGTPQLYSDTSNSAKAPAAMSGSVVSGGSLARSCLPGYWNAMTSKCVLSAFDNWRYHDAPAPACGKISSGCRATVSELWNFLIHPCFCRTIVPHSRMDVCAHAQPDALSAQGHEMARMVNYVAIQLIWLT